jgi:hypothetical protein
VPIGILYITHTEKRKGGQIMKQGMAIDEFLAELRRQDAAKRDFIAPSNLVHLRTEEVGEDAEGNVTKRPVMVVPTKERDVLCDINEHAHGQIAARTGIPKQYYDRMRDEEPELLGLNVNRWFERKAEPRMVRTLAPPPVATLEPRPVVRAFLSDKYRALDNVDVANTVLPIVMEAGAREIKSTALTETHMYLQCVSERIQGEVKVGDVVQAGIVLSNSEVGAGAVRLEGLLYRLSCLNGAIRGQALKKFHIGGRSEVEMGEVYSDATRLAMDATFLMKLKDVANHLMDEEGFAEYLEDLRAAADDKIVRGEGKLLTEVVEVAGKRFGFGQGEGLQILENLSREGDMSRWGFANAVTATANETGSYDRAIELERMGGKIIEMSKNEWSQVWKAAA